MEFSILISFKDSDQVNGNKSVEISLVFVPCALVNNREPDIQIINDAHLGNSQRGAKDNTL